MKNDQYEAVLQGLADKWVRGILDGTNVHPNEVAERRKERASLIGQLDISVFKYETAAYAIEGSVFVDYLGKHFAMDLEAHLNNGIWSLVGTPTWLGISNPADLCPVALSNHTFWCPIRETCFVRLLEEPINERLIMGDDPDEIHGLYTFAGNEARLIYFNRPLWVLKEHVQIPPGLFFLLATYAVDLPELGIIVRNQPSPVSGNLPLSVDSFVNTDTIFRGTQVDGGFVRPLMAGLLQEKGWTDYTNWRQEQVPVAYTEEGTLFAFRDKLYLKGNLVPNPTAEQLAAVFNWQVS